ncbi:uncharacterized protein BKA78DRAFT_300774 [Phyllosticta capitalensis]|uniref:uncharacterized protein n=1 Tax=Phyllosticta capitalensis TaxID=121624 RepID=UPI00312D80DA
MWLKIRFFSPFEYIGHLKGYFKLWQEDVTEIAKSGRRFELINHLMSEREVPYMSLDFKNIMQETWIGVVFGDVSLLQHFILHIGHGPSSAWDALVAANCQRFREDYPNADEELMEWREQRRPADWDMHYVSLWRGRPSSSQLSKSSSKALAAPFRISTLKAYFTLNPLNF